MDATPPSAGDAIPRECQVIEIRVAELRQLFNAIDPAPFRERDLDPRAEAFIVEWSREVPAETPLALLVHVEQAPGPPDEAVILRDAIHEFFRERGARQRRQLRTLFRHGRISLAIGLTCLATSIGIGDALATAAPDSRWTGLLSESLLIGGWVAMWRPMEVFLYDWWPIRAEARLSERLTAMPVRIVYPADAAATAGRSHRPT